MRYSIRHTTTYRFDRPVFLEPHTVRLTPRRDGYFHPTMHRLGVEPSPAGMTTACDPWGNAVHRVWFEGLTETLRFVSECEGETLRENPFDYLLEPAALMLPPRYTPSERASLAACLECPPSPAVPRFGDRISRSLSSGEPNTVEYLLELNRVLCAEHSSVIRMEGDPFEPEVTLETHDVTCRDLAVLFVAACRCRGIAARFVSGYQAGDPDQRDRHLHAWAEAYLPGAGWRGYDPTLGLAVADQHVAVAAAAHWSDAASISGTFRGTEAHGTMASTIELDTVR